MLQVKCTGRPDPTQKMGNTQEAAEKQTHNRHKYLFIRISRREQVICMSKTWESHLFSVTRLGITHYYKSLLKLSHSNFPDDKSPWPKGKPETWGLFDSNPSKRAALCETQNFCLNTTTGMWAFPSSSKKQYSALHKLPKEISLPHTGVWKWRTQCHKVEIILHSSLPVPLPKGWDPFGGVWKQQNILPLSQTHKNHPKSDHTFPKRTKSSTSLFTRTRRGSEGPRLSKDNTTKAPPKKRPKPRQFFNFFPHKTPKAIWGKESLQVSSSGTAEERTTKTRDYLSPWIHLRASVNLSAAFIPHRVIFRSLQHKVVTGCSCPVIPSGFLLPILPNFTFQREAESPDQSESSSGLGNAQKVWGEASLRPKRWSAGKAAGGIHQLRKGNYYLWFSISFAG